MAAESAAVRRLCRDFDKLQQQGHPQISVKPSSMSRLHWHFVLHNFPKASACRGGMYHGKLSFPERYPFAPPWLMMYTPNGILPINRWVCMRMTGSHPGNWNPDWTVESLLLWLLAFMDDENYRGCFDSDGPVNRQSFAAISKEFNLSNTEFREHFPELTHEGAGSTIGCFQDSTLSGVEEQGAAVCNPSIVEHLAEASTGARSSWRQSLPCAQQCRTQLPGIMTLDTATRGTAFAAPKGEVIVESAWSSCEAGPVSSVEVDCEAFLEEGAIEECWICREDGSLEPLVQPCACHGSMHGVHASCLEAWVSHYRSNAMGTGWPQCSICGQIYRGTEWRPGLAGFARQICTDFLQQAVRSGMLMAFSVSFWLGAQEQKLAIWVRVPLLMAAALFFLCKALVLAVSLPWDSPPPQNRYCRRFHTDGKQAVAIHIAEFCSTLVIALLWYLHRQLKWYHLTFLCCLSIVPLFSMLIRQGSKAWTVPGLRLLVIVLLSPVFPLAFFVHRAWHEPWRMVDPTHALIHLLVPVITVPLCLLNDSNAPILIVWTLHCLVLLVSLADKLVVRRATWNEGRLWWIFLQFSLLAAYLANILNSFTEGFFLEQSRRSVVACVSILWSALCCTLAISVNWGLCVQYYHTWQSRNGSFTCNPTAAAATPTSADIPVASASGSAARRAGIDCCGPASRKLGKSIPESWAAAILGAETDLHGHGSHYESSCSPSRNCSRSRGSISSDVGSSSVSSVNVASHRIVRAMI